MTQQPIQLRRGTPAEWAASTVVLAQGEPGLVVDPTTGQTTNIKNGDGQTQAYALPVFNPTPKGSAKQVNIVDKGSATGLLNYATSTVGTSEVYYTVGIAASNISFLYTHWYTDNGSGVMLDTDPAGSITFSASVRVVSTTNPATTVSTTPWRISFNGRTTATLDPGGRVTSDIVGLSLNAGDVIAVRTYLSSGTAYPYRAMFAFTGTRGGFTSTTDLTMSTTAISASSGNFYCPAQVRGFVDTASRGRSVFVPGDSIGAATGDVGSLYTVPTLYPGGYLIRALSGHAGLLNASVGGDLLTWFQATVGSRYRLAAAAQADAAIIEPATNDFTLAITAATVQASLLDVATKVRRMGLNPVYAQTITPRTTSTDNWATVANQTPIAGNDQRVIYNTWLRAGCPINPTTLAAVAVGTSGALLAGQYQHPITGVFDTAAQVESSLNSGAWAAANRVATGSITASASTLTTSSTTFNTAIQENGGDLGSYCFLAGAGASGAVLSGYLSAVASSTSATINTAAGTTVANGVLVIGTMTVDGVHPSPRGHYLMSQVIDTSKLVG